MNTKVWPHYGVMQYKHFLAHVEAAGDFLRVFFNVNIPDRKKRQAGTTDGPGAKRPRQEDNGAQLTTTQVASCQRTASGRHGLQLTTVPASTHA